MEKPIPWPDRLKRALLPYAIPWKAPELQRFIDRRCKELDLPNPATGRQTVYNWMSGKKPTAEGYAILARILNVSMRWLVEGQGDMRRSVKLTPGEAEVVHIFDQLAKLNPEARDAWVGQGRAWLAVIEPKGANNPYRR